MGSHPGQKFLALSRAPSGAGEQVRGNLGDGSVADPVALENTFVDKFVRRLDQNDVGSGGRRTRSARDSRWSVYMTRSLGGAIGAHCTAAMLAVTA